MHATRGSPPTACQMTWNIYASLLRQGLEVERRFVYARSLDSIEQITDRLMAWL